MNFIKEYYKDDKKNFTKLVRREKTLSKALKRQFSDINTFCKHQEKEDLLIFNLNDTSFTITDICFDFFGLFDIYFYTNNFIATDNLVVEKTFFKTRLFIYNQEISDEDIIDEVDKIVENIEAFLCGDEDVKREELFPL